MFGSNCGLKTLIKKFFFYVHILFILLLFLGDIRHILNTLKIRQLSSFLFSPFFFCPFSSPSSSYVVSLRLLTMPAVLLLPLQSFFLFFLFFFSLSFFFSCLFSLPSFLLLHHPILASISCTRNRASNALFCFRVTGRTRPCYGHSPVSMNPWFSSLLPLSASASPVCYVQLSPLRQIPSLIPAKPHNQEFW